MLLQSTIEILTYNELTRELGVISLGNHALVSTIRD